MYLTQTARTHKRALAQNAARCTLWPHNNAAERHGKWTILLKYVYVCQRGCVRVCVCVCVSELGGGIKSAPFHFPSFCPLTFFLFLLGNIAFVAFFLSLFISLSLTHTHTHTHTHAVLLKEVTRVIFDTAYIPY